MTLLLGIDEAGYGPILGPLVVSGVTMELPDSCLGQDLWEILRLSIARTAKGSSGRILINDSKLLHKKSAKTNLLQRGTLAALYAIHNSIPHTIADLLTRLNCQGLDSIAEYPWYRDRLTHWPLHFDSDDIQTAGSSLRSDCRQHYLELKEVTSCPLMAGSYNQMVHRTQNKATVLFNTACQIIHHIWTAYPEHNLQAILDKQGGRSHYREHLQRMYPDLSMKILKETDTVSSYQLSAARRFMKVHFLQKGDQKNMLIALASMTSKYLRELFMEVLNDYFLKLSPTLKPTAGYYQDGTRFLADLKSTGLLDSLPQHLLIRDK